MTQQRCGPRRIVLDPTNRDRILQDGVEGCRWSLSGAILRAHACTRRGQWAHSAFDCPVHRNSLQEPTIGLDDVHRVLTGAHPSRFRDGQGNLPPGFRERQREFYRELDGRGQR